MSKTALTATAALAFVTALISAQAPQRAPDPRSMGGGDCRDNADNCADAPNPLPIPNTVWIEEMTWMDVRDSLKAGHTTDGMPDDGLHDGPGITLNMLLTDPNSVRWEARVEAKKATINGVDISNLD